MNDVMRHLHEHADEYGFTFTKDPDASDAIITNDVFPPNLPNLPKIKRMDGIYWQNHLLERNEGLNSAATQADHVVFISDFSRRSYFELYGDPLKAHSVVLNQADPNIFSPQVVDTRSAERDFSLVAAANSWQREEKRLTALLSLAEKTDVPMYLIGGDPGPCPPNVQLVGYLETPAMLANQLRKHKAFVNFSYRDAGPKTVQQALNCGLPVLYADSGGVRESVGSCGVAVADPVKEPFEDKSPELDLQSLVEGFENLLANLPIYTATLTQRDSGALFRGMLDGYFKAIASVLR